MIHERGGLVSKADTSIRLGFIRKVYGILSAQLLFTGIMVAASINSPELAKIVSNPAMVIFMSILSLATICPLACCGFDRMVPVNYILLGLFTLSEAWLVSTIAISYDRKVVLEAAFLTAGVCVALTLYAATTKTDFTICGPLLFVMMIVMCIASIFACTMGPDMNLVFASFGAILFGFYLIYDTQIIIGGDHK